MISHLKETYKIISYDTVIDKSKIDFNKFKIDKILLSSINEIPREIVEQLEIAGIFDVGEFMEMASSLKDYLGLSTDELEHYITILNSYTKTYFLHFTNDLPNNYCLVGLSSNGDENAMAFLWKEFLFLWSNPKSEGWSLVKHMFDKTYNNLNHPEIITSFSVDIPSWLINPSDISKYIAGLPPSKNIHDILFDLGFPKYDTTQNAIIVAEQMSLELAYLIEICQEINSSV